MKNLIYLFISISIILNACSESKTPNECVSFLQTGIAAITLDPTVDMMGAVYKVDFPISNGCGKFNKFEETIDGNTRIVKVIAKYEGCICTQDFSIKSTNYVFTSSVPGTYTLKFLKADGTFFIETVVIA
ncbi:MAG: hypothetical protein H7195_01155 [Chryseobacterium sp.]|nr:hypothetical protein [Chryseobacterium sp.]